MMSNTLTKARKHGISNIALRYLTQCLLTVNNNNNNNVFIYSGWHCCLKGTFKTGL